MGRLVYVDDVIRAVDAHTYNDCSLDEDISVILEEVPTATFRPTELYAVEDCISGMFIFNAKGGCYKDIESATKKIKKLYQEKGGTYRVIKYVLSVDFTEKPIC